MAESWKRTGRELNQVLEEIKSAKDGITAAEDRLNEVQKELKTADGMQAKELKEERLYLRSKEIALRQLLFELQQTKNRLAQAQDRSAAAGLGPGSAAAASAADQKLDIILAQQQVLSQQQQAILTSISATIASTHLPPSSLDTAARQGLRGEVLTAYAALADNGWVWCVVTGQFWPPFADTGGGSRRGGGGKSLPHVRACHIFQRKWGITEWAGLKLGSSPDTPVNVIPMHGAVEHAFDSHQVIVLPSQAEEDGETIFTVHVLDSKLLQKTVYGEYKCRHKSDSSSWVEPPPELAAIKFKDIDKTPLKFVTGSDKRPAKRCFMAHALWSLVLAKALEWPVDPGISVTVDSFGWKSPTFMQARERTALWVHMQGQVAGVDGDGLPTGSIDGLPTGSVDDG